MDESNQLFEKKLDKAFKSNACAMILWDGFWSIGMPFCMYATVVPTYLLHLGVSKTLIQLVVVGFSVITLAQFFTGPLLGHSKRKEWIFFTWIFFSFCWFIYGSLAYLFWDKFPLSFWIPFFVLICALLSSARHYGTPTLRGVVIENIPLKKRGLLAGMRSLVLGGGGLVGTYLVSLLLSSDGDVTAFHKVFLIGSVIFIFACFPFLLLFKDYAIEGKHTNNNNLSLLESGRVVLQEKNFRKFLILYCLMFAAQNLAPLLIAYGKDVLNLKAQMVSGLNMVYFASAIILGSTLPILADRFGFKLLAILSSFMLMICFLVPLFTHAGMYWLFFSYFLYSGSFQLTQLLLGNFGTELLPQVKPTAIIVIGSTLVMPIALILSPLCGNFIDLFGPQAYFYVFIFATFISLLSLLGFIFLVKEPRHYGVHYSSPNPCVEQKLK